MEITFSLLCVCSIRRKKRSAWTALNGESPSALWTDRGITVTTVAAHNVGHLLHTYPLCSSVHPSFRLSLGDWSGSLVLGEGSWPLVYGVAVDLLGSDLVHRYVGVEEYSRYDSPFTLTKTGPTIRIKSARQNLHVTVES